MNTSDLKQVTVMEEKDKSRKEILDGNIKIVLQSKAGRQMVWWLLGLTRDSEISYVRGGVDAERETNFNEGQRQVGLQLKAKIESILPGSYALMTNEAKENVR